MGGKEALLGVLGRPYAYSILESLKEPKRFGELAKACPIEKTRSKRIKELLDAGLIVHHFGAEGAKGFICYKLSKKGERILKILNKV